MSYQVLARKWRPRNFAELVGQEHVMRALINALDNDRLHHAFLFTGTRGVGKTTIARILAKSLNCEHGVSSKPCGTCTSCREIDEGRFVDLIEVDAASRTKVEDTRDLLDNVQYAPTRGRYKVYLIDEVHMLSTHSFNALLKTLEEPPPHVKFLLATTDPQKLPITILSRCLQFNLKRLPQSAIHQHLDAILQRENIAHDPEATLLLARAADGSMRDALSLMDQAIAFCGGKLAGAEVGAMLGSIDRDYVFALLDALAQRDAARLFAQVRAMAQQSPDFSAVLAELTSVLQRVALAQQVPDAIDATLEDRDRILHFAAAITPADVQLYYQIGILGRRDLPLAGDAQGGFEMVLLRMLAFVPTAESVTAPAEPRPAATPAATRTMPPAVSAPPAARAAGDESDWNQMVQNMPLAGLAKQLAAHCVLQRLDADSVRLSVHASNSKLITDNARERLQTALSDYLKRPVKLHIDVAHETQRESPAQVQQRAQDARQTAAKDAVQRDRNVQSLLETFNAKIDSDSVRPLD
jgi:DNA polymerase-3 subunit gamma/tau